MTIKEKSLYLLRYLPRVSLGNVERSVFAKKILKRKAGQYAERKKKRDHPEFRYQMKYLPVGFNFDKTPFKKFFPRELYYADIKDKKQYPPLSLHSLQMMLDSKILLEDEPIDLASLCNTHHFKIDPYDNCFGVHLTDEGIDQFKSKINIEVQHASENVIAAIEKNGGTIITSYYDIDSVIALHNPEKFFKRGDPIPKRLLPSPDKFEYYTDAKFRGYLADPDKIAEERLKLSQKYGYELPDLDKDPKKHILLARKDPKQVFFGLEPGWVVNLKDKEILVPEDEEIIKYYNS